MSSTNADTEAALKVWRDTAFAWMRTMVLGQILPGAPVWELGLETRFPRLPYVAFPGNVGAPEALNDVVQKLKA